MENLLEYLLTVILRNADDVNPSFGRCFGEDAFKVASCCCFVLTTSEIREIRSMFAERWRYLCESERRDIYDNLKKMKK